MRHRHAVIVRAAREQLRLENSSFLVPLLPMAGSSTRQSECLAMTVCQLIDVLLTHERHHGHILHHVKSLPVEQRFLISDDWKTSLSRDRRHKSYRLLGKESPLPKDLPRPHVEVVLLHPAVHEISFAGLEVDRGDKSTTVLDLGFGAGARLDQPLCPRDKLRLVEVEVVRLTDRPCQARCTLCRIRWAVWREVRPPRGLTP